MLGRPADERTTPLRSGPIRPPQPLERQREAWLGRDPAELARVLEQRRNAAHQEFSQRLSNAWRAR